YVAAAGDTIIGSSFSNALTSSLNVTLTSQGTTVPGSITIGFSGGFQTIAEVNDGGGPVLGQLIVPAVASGQMISASAADLGSATAILAGGTLMLTGHGSNSGQFFGAGTLELNLPGATQVVKLTNATAGFGGNDSFSGFTGTLKIDNGTLDLSADITSITSTITASLAGPGAQINVNSATSGHLSLSSIAGGAAIDVTNVSPASIDMVNSGVFSTTGGGAVLNLVAMSGGGSLFQVTLPASALAFVGNGNGLQILPDGGTGTLVAFGNSSLSVAASTFSTAADISGG